MKHCMFILLFKELSQMLTCPGDNFIGTTDAYKALVMRLFHPCTPEGSKAIPIRFVNQIIQNY